MKHTIFTTRLRAEEILKEALIAWKQSNQSEHLEGIEQDPVFSLFMTALAYQANEMDSEITRLKSDILEEFARMLVPYESLRALPATAVVTTKLDDTIVQQDINHKNSFLLQDTPFNFIPLLQTKLINGNVSSVIRLDARRWQVNLQFIEPINSLQGMTFMITNHMFQDLKVFLNGHALPLIKPWDYADLPLAECFSIDNMIYAKSSIYQASSTWFDLFAKQNVRLFCIDSYRATNYTPSPTSNFELTFEFFGIDNNFFLNKEQLLLNCMVLVNANINSVTISPSSPLARITRNTNQQFLHLIKPSDKQILDEEPIMVRKIATERFNSDRLIKLVSNLIYKFKTDYYAFINIKELNDGRFLDQFQTFIKRLSNSLNDNSQENVGGIYVSLKNKFAPQLEGKSLQIDYLLTDGASVNEVLNNKSIFNAPTDSFIKSVELVADPLPGFNGIQGPDAEHMLASYYMITNDRVVTPADIKILCFNELLTRFSITTDMIVGIKVKNMRSTEYSQCGFKTIVYIGLKNDPYIKRSLEKEIPLLELTIQKMIEVRSTNVFPVQVSINII